jgi:hypothetical protein
MPMTKEGRIKFHPASKTHTKYGQAELLLRISLECRKSETYTPVEEK